MEQFLNNDSRLAHKDTKTYCCKEPQLNPLFEDIQPYDFIGPIKKLNEFFSQSLYPEQNYYQYIYDKYKNTFQEIYQKKYLYIQGNGYAINELALQYTKCFPQMNLSIIFSEIFNPKKIAEYKNLKNIHILKKLYLNLNQVLAIINSYYSYEPSFRNYNRLLQIAKEIMKEKRIILCYVFFYLPKNNKNNLINPTNNIYHINNFNLMIDLAQIFFNKTSLETLKYQRLDRILRKESDPSHVMLMSYKSQLYKNFTQLEQLNFMIFSSAVLYIIGTTYSADIDFVVNEKGNSEKFKKEVLKLFESKNEFDIFDLSMRGHRGWEIGGKKEYLDQWLQYDWPNLFGAPDLTTVYFHPKYHFYYLGVKFICLEADVARRIQRMRPTSYADLISLKIFNGIIPDIPEMPDKIWFNHKEIIITKEIVINFFKKTKKYLKEWHNIDISYSEISNFIKPQFKFDYKTIVDSTASEGNNKNHKK